MLWYTLSMSNAHSQNMDFESLYIAANGVKLHVKTCGSGAPCLLLHGYPQTWYTWRHVMKELSPHFTVVAPDFRGWGESEKKPPYNLRVMVEDTLALMDELKITKAHLVGHDWGAAVAYLIARDYPEHVEKLVTVNMPVRRFDWTKTLHFYFFNMMFLPEIIMRLNSDAVVKFIIRWWAHNRDAFPDDALRVYQYAARQPSVNKATLGYYRNSLRSMLFARGGKNLKMGPLYQAKIPSVPWHVLWGDKDSVSPMKNVEYFKEDCPGVPVTLIENAGHFPQEEQPGIFNSHLLSFLLNSFQS